MYHKVFINNREIAIVNAPLDGYVEIPTFLNIDKFYTFLDDEEAIKNEEKLAVVDVKGTFWSAFKKAHKCIEAAGGVVLNSDEDLLLIHRLGFWDLPKGKLEKDEMPEEAAVREVEEECGISNLEITGQYADTYHTYILKGQVILKKTYWYLMKYHGNETLIPQTEEHIDEVRFMPEDEVREVAMKETYKSLLPLFNSYLLRNK